MDGLSAAASGFAVVSLAVQLGESAVKLYDFCKACKGAPEQVEQLIEDLVLLKNIFNSIVEAQVFVSNFIEEN